MKKLKASLAGFLIAVSPALAQTAPSIIPFDPEGIHGPGARTTGSGETEATSFAYYEVREKPGGRAGIWETNGFHGRLRKTNNTEFIHLLRGVITLADKDGQELVFHAGDSLLIPRGTEVAWKKTENVREYWVIFDTAAADAAPATPGEPRVMRLDPDHALTYQEKPGRARTGEFEYYAGADKSSVGVWETAPSTAAAFHTPKYSEFMYFLKGPVTLSTPDGKSRTFEAGDAVLVPRGAAYKWSSQTARKFWVIFDQTPAAASSTDASK